MDERELLLLIERDQWMMEVLKTVKTLELPDCWVCAGFVRSKIWDTLHGFKERTPLPDIDVIYFDPVNVSEEVERNLESTLAFLLPDHPWSVKNEARMHFMSSMSPYSSSIDAISKFPETCTSLAIKFNQDHKLVLAAPYGIKDAVNLEVKPTPFFAKDEVRAAIYEERISKKNWVSIWSKLKIHHTNR